MKEQILKKLIEKTGQNLTLETNVNELDIDSLDLMTYIFEIEEEYQIELDQDQLTNMKIVDDLVSSIVLKIEQGA